MHQCGSHFFLIYVSYIYVYISICVYCYFDFFVHFDYTFCCFSRYFYSFVILCVCVYRLHVLGCLIFAVSRSPRAGSALCCVPVVRGLVGKFFLLVLLVWSVAPFLLFFRMGCFENNSLFVIIVYKALWRWY
jgi:hypothetical protein